MKPTDTTADNLRRVIRGGGWYDNEPSWVRAASRLADVPAYRDDDFGFRTHLPVRQPRV